MTPPPGLAGLILTGGFSTRMGRDKGSLPWQGARLAHYQSARLANLLPQVFLSCRSEQQTVYSGPFPLIPDTCPSGGPISGLLSAMHARPGLAWLTLAVDMPGISEATLRHLLAHRALDRIATAFRQPDGIIQPLVAVWEPAALPLLEKAWQEQRLSLRRLLEHGQAAILEAPPGDDWQNLNTPDEWARYTATSASLQQP